MTSPIHRASRRLLPLLGAVVLAGAASTPAAAQRGGWEELGCVSLDRRGGQESINVGKRDGRFNAVRFFVKRNDVEIDNLRVIYGNGDRDPIKVRKRLREGDRTRIIDLEGRNRFIRRIQIDGAKVRRSGRGEARICAEGLHKAPRPRMPEVRAGWDELGCVDVGRRTERDIIRVGRRDGRYRALRLTVERRDVEIDNVRVIYGNGRPDNLPIREFMRAGSQTRSIDLKGRDRFISEIQVVANKARRSGRGQARICAYGLQIKRGSASFKPKPRVRDRRGGRDRWEVLGCKKVAFLNDRDTISVGRREGRFKAIRLDAHDVSVEVMRVVVNYGNGDAERLPFSGKVTKGTSSPALDLTGRRRAIHSITLLQRAKLNIGRLNFLKGGSTVCVSGLQ